MAVFDENISGYRSPGDLEIEAITLITASGVSIDVQNLIAEFSIYQDISKHYLECDFVFDDAIGLGSSLPGGINGNEFIKISYYNRGEEENRLTHLFHIYSVTGRKRISEFRETYLLSGVSVEKIVTSGIKISRAYGPSTITSMVSKIVDEFVYNTNAKSYYEATKQIAGGTVVKENTIDPTSGVQKLILPNLDIDASLDFLCNEADSDDHIPYYFFYEDTKGFNFRNLSTLVEQEPKRTYKHIIMNTDPPEQSTDPEKDTLPIESDDAFKILTYDIVKQTNTLQANESGMFRSRIINIDIHRKNKKEVVYDYDNWWSKFKKLQDKQIAGGAVPEANPVITMMASRTGHDIDPNYVKENVYPKRINEFLIQKKGYQKTTFNTVLDVMIPGDANYVIGDTINLEFYNYGSGITENLDKYISGKYIITKIRQKVSGGKTGAHFVSLIQCTKNTLTD